MRFRASNKRWISALAAAVMVCVCVTASAQSYRLGDEADEIATIQTALKQLKLYSAGITGHYGEKTETAVKKFQKKYALEDNGVVDEATRAALYEAAGITYTAGSSSSSGASSSNSSVSSSSGTTLRYDMRSDAVLKLQQDLSKLGYYSGTISGHFGSKTEAAVMSFQKANGLSADGIAGSKTLAKIATALGNSSSSSSSNSSSSNSSSSSAASSSLLKQGTKSEAVRTLQQNLKTLGYYTGSVTGNFGPLTKEAVYSFQKANGLSADGVAGEKTLAAISSKLKGGSSSGSSNNSSSSSSSGSNSSSSSTSSLLNTSITLQQGTKNDEVLKLQNMLASLGFYTGNKTGNFGEKTADAVIAYQKSKGLTADGIAGKKTLAAINADYSGSSVIGNNNGNANAPTPSMANNVIYENFYNWRRNYANGEYCTIYDFSTGYSWKLRIMTKDAHMDAEPATAEDTAIMLKAFGNKTTWTPKAVWVTFSDGKTYIGSTHDVPHSPQHLTSNNFAGHLCVHFPIPMSKAESIGSYAVSHQEAINEGWEMTQKLKY
ncbi:MAG: peptidoglycan-binding protein [Christensenellales bacterium]|nr:peptidoglycan-binding protein [Christensenellales bacterium]